MNLNLDDIKKEIEERTPYVLEKSTDILDRECLVMLGLDRKSRIDIHISNYAECYKDGAEYIAVHGSKGHGGFGSPCDSVDEVIERLETHAEKYGYKPVQQSFI